MQITVLIESTPGNGFRARTGEPLALTAEGASREEALSNLSEQIKSRVHNGAELVPLEVPAKEHPWAAFAGTLKDDPLYDEWREAIAEYRRKRDEEDGLP